MSFLRRMFANAAGLGGLLVQRLGIAISDDYADEASHPVVTAGSGAASASDPNGSVHLRTDGVPEVRISSAWKAVAVAGQTFDSGSAGIKADIIAESTSAAGVTADSVLLKDGSVTVGSGGQVITDTIAEKTSAAGVTIDGCLIKDGRAAALATAAMFLSAEVTGNGSEQDTAHGLGAAPSLVFVVPSELTGGAFTVAYGTHDGTNTKTTVTAGEKYRVVAFK